MIASATLICAKCGGKLVHYDSVNRIVRGKYREKKYIRIRRLRCKNCRTIHRELADSMKPYKQYDAEIIDAVCEGLITWETIGFEDYPCEATMRRWLSYKHEGP